MPGGTPGKPSAFKAIVTVNGAIQAADRIAAMGDRARYTAPLMERMVEELAAISRARVQDAPYIPLTSGTVGRKAGQGENTAILRDEWRPVKGTPTRQGDKLYRALTVDGAPGQLRRVTRTTATFGVKSAGQGELFYARFVQNVHGTKRRILAISEGEALSITQRVGNWIMDIDLSVYRSADFVGRVP